MNEQQRSIYSNHTEQFTSQIDLIVFTQLTDAEYRTLVVLLGLENDPNYCSGHKRWCDELHFSDIKRNHNVAKGCEWLMLQGFSYTVIKTDTSKTTGANDRKYMDSG